MKIKKTLALVTTLSLMLLSLSLTAFAADGVEMYVTIADGSGKVVLTQQKLTVTDADSDGKITIDDALFLTHELKYSGGAAAGYKSSVGAYGKSLDKLWGVENGGSYGYYVNNASALSLDDEVKNGDSLYAYAYSDLSAWSDTYSFFDKNTASLKADEDFTLTLSAAAFDASWNPITVPVANAVITIDGKATSYKTDSTGKATIKFSENGTHTVSATSSTMTLVPPVLTVSVTGAKQPAPAPVPVEKNPETGSFENAFSSLIVLGASSALLTVVIKKKNEK